jgi:hypothetical protein
MLMWDVSVNTVKKVMYKVVETVEHAISDYMKDAKFGALMYDGWTKDSIHYIGYFATFMRGYAIRKKRVTELALGTDIVLLSVAPMERDDGDDDDDGDGSDDDERDDDDEHRNKIRSASFGAKTKSAKGI